ncbi:hypothetical protein K438DRAFT_1603909, partial [Mycena galopus ATCC 62051]
PIVAQLAAATGQVVAWAGNTCDGNEGKVEGCDGGCINFVGRFSIQTFDPVNAHCVSVFEDQDCNSEVGVYLNQDLGSCITVNTGTAVGSFICNPGNTC